MQAMGIYATTSPGDLKMARIVLWSAALEETHLVT